MKLVVKGSWTHLWREWTVQERTESEQKRGNLKLPTSHQRMQVSEKTGQPALFFFFVYALFSSFQSLSYHFKIQNFKLLRWDWKRKIVAHPEPTTPVSVPAALSVLPGPWTWHPTFYIIVHIPGSPCLGLLEVRGNIVVFLLHPPPLPTVRCPELAHSECLG